MFDIMYVGGYDVRDLPLLARKQLLHKLLDYNQILIYTQHRSPDGVKYFQQACKLHWEGLIAKRSGSTYVSIRSRDWLKFKCIMKQEFVVAGYTDPKGSRTDFGALLVGYYEGKKLLYAGKVGTGFDHIALELLGKKLRALQTKICPFDNYTLSTAGVHWVKPQLVIEVQFAQWTNASRLRVPRYKGLRDDKAARDVVKEVPTG